MIKAFRSLHVKTLMAALLLVGSLAPTMSAAPTALLTDGKTTVTLSNDFLAALVALRLSAGTVGEGTLRSGVASFPVTGGALDLATAKGDFACGDIASATASVQQPVSSWSESDVVRRSCAGAEHGVWGDGVCARVQYWYSFAVCNYHEFAPQSIR